MKSEKLRKKLTNNIIVSAMITALVGGICIAISVWLFSDNNGFNSSAVIGTFVLVIFLVVFIGGLVAFIQLCRDLRNVKRQKFLTVSGIPQKHIWDSGGEGAPAIIGAVIVSDDNEEISLNVGELILGEKYTFQYSPITKTAVIIDGANKKAKSSFMSVKLPFWTAPLIFFCVSLILGSVFLAAFYKVDNLVKNGVITTAIVDEVRITTDGEGNPKYNVYIKYEINGTTYREKLPFNIKKQTGDVLEIRYLPDNPSEFQWVHDEYAIPIILGGSSVISFFIGTIFLIAFLVKRKKSPTN